VPFWIAFALSGVVAAAIGFFVGFVSLRLKGHYFSIFTLCVGYIMYLLVEKWESLTHGTVGDCLDFERMQFAERGDLIERQRGVVYQPYSRSFWHEQLLSHRYSPSVRPRRGRGRGINH
jgi:ABC-type branched-subunit amino acid transport system permease subunit